MEVPVPLNGCGSKGGDVGVAEVGPPGVGLAPKSHFSNVCCTLTTSPVRGKEALPVIPIQFSSRTGGNRQLFRVAAEWTKMDSQRLPLQLLLLLLTVAHELDAYSGTTVTPWDANVSLQPASNKSALDHKDENQENVTVAFPYYADAYEEYAARCWFIFVHQMDNVSNAQWCHWRAIRRPYKNLRFCLEKSAEDVNYTYPNALAEEYTFFSHRIYFLNCTSEQQVLRDPPENVLLTLILTPICLIPFLVTLVVWKSKGEMKS